MEHTEQQEKGCGSCHGVMGGRHGTVTVVLLLLAAFLFALTIRTFKEISYVGGGIAPTNAISVTGNGEVLAVPDTAEFTFTIIEEGDTAVAVRNAAAAKADAAIAALTEKGIAKEDMKNISYQIQPKYEWQPVTCVRFPCDRTQVQQGFTLNQTIQVKVRDLDKAGEMLETVTNAGVQSVGGISFTVADVESVRAEARKAAIDEARAKAETLATDLGVSLVRIVGFSEDGNYPMPYFAESAMSAVGGDMAIKTAPTLPVGENSITSNVHITYEIR